MPTVRCTGQMSRWSSSAKLAPLSPPCLPSTGDSAVVLRWQDARALTLTFWLFCRQFLGKLALSNFIFDLDQHHSGPHQLNCSQQRRGFVLICFSCVLVLSQSEQISYRACHTCHTATAAVKIFGNGKMDDYSVAEP